jgi:hypothetical protein
MTAVLLGHLPLASSDPSMADNLNTSEPAPPWHSIYPTPRLDIPRISPADLADLVGNKKAGVDYIVVDVRRTDFEVIDNPTYHNSLISAYRLGRVR